ncbi:MAG: hypothetical protein KIT79_12610 [Deltaproteobacteria bacterium]|nr:hypothetical protein [Deltaproteobacteria bacterium]
MINGRTYDWETIKILLPKNIEVHCTGINYATERVMNHHHGKDAEPGIGLGPRTHSGDLAMNREGFNQLMLYVRGMLKAYADELPPFPVIVHFGNSGEVGFTDLLYNVRIKKHALEGASRESTNTTVKLDFLCTKIDWAVPSPNPLPVI